MRVTGLALGGFTFCSLAISAFTAMANPTIFPTGTTIYDPERAWNGYVLFSAPTGNTHLIDMDGNEVNQWNRPGFPAEMLDPAMNDGKKGHILVQIENNEGMWGGIFDNVAIGEVDWSGETVWSWRGENGEGRRPKPRLGKATQWQHAGGGGSPANSPGALQDKNHH